jgi:hypothetical protein
VAALPEQIGGGPFALQMMSTAMAFDESMGGIEHDLSTLTFVALPGYPDATEYHGLMFFDSSLLVVDQRGWSDDDLLLIMANIAHEYGHHVRGNRITVSSWGQLALKEGLTVLMGQNDTRRPLVRAGGTCARRARPAPAAVPRGGHDRCAGRARRGRPTPSRCTRAPRT